MDTFAGRHETPLDPQDAKVRQRTPIKRVAFASFVGSAIEYYDFFLFGTAAALVFPTVFFPDLSPTMAIVASMTMFAVAFLARPVGAAVFGHFGDRFGRKRTLIATMLIMGASTMAVGLVPGAAYIGAAAPAVLLILRLLQGFAVGGEWAGAALLSSEYAPVGKRGRYGIFTQIGVGTGLVMTNLIFLAVNATIGENSTVFLSWGWRIPFLLSAALIAVALYARLRIDETPVFLAEKARFGTLRSPIADLLRAQLREVVLVAGSVVGTSALSYIVSVYMVSYAHIQLGQSRSLCLFVGVLGGLSAIASIAVSATLSDTLGRRRVVLFGLALCLPWSIAVMPLVTTGNPFLFAVTVVLTHAIAGVPFGPLAAFIPEIFTTRHRYSGVAFALNMGGIIGAAVPPIVAGPLMAAFGGVAITAMMALFLLVSLVCCFLLPETVATTLTETMPVESRLGPVAPEASWLRS